MRTYRELVYSVLDELKIFSDDSVWETDHIVSLLIKYRGLLFTQKYKGKKVEIPFAYYQRLKVDFINENMNAGLVKSIKQLPNILDITNIYQYTFIHTDGMNSFNMNFINPQRFKNVGYNKWLKNQVYITIDLDNKMYAKSPVYNLTGLDSTNIEFLLVDESDIQIISEHTSNGFLYYDTILDNPIEGYRFNDDNTLDVLDFIFPCEESLIQPIIDLCIKEISVINGIPRDATNNATDDSSLPKQQN
jgi:hypothetical protein